MANPDSGNTNGGGGTPAGIATKTPLPLWFVTSFQAWVAAFAASTVTGHPPRKRQSPRRLRFGIASLRESGTAWVSVSRRKSRGDRCHRGLGWLSLGMGLRSADLKSRLGTGSMDGDDVEERPHDVGWVAGNGSTGLTA
ncbi:hypothetical protein TIFTF001_045841 [Ficus carica]|uniref:Uncharacterized protein n=1 Tax=Ficus carica TaxID=3494 RepID=A0AA88CP45_FICCA|nr:hypothetical protein TIFTF001_045841 [Ficus carica]